MFLPTQDRCERKLFPSFNIFLFLQASVESSVLHCYHNLSKRLAIALKHEEHRLVQYEQCTIPSTHQHTRRSSSPYFSAILLKFHAFSWTPVFRLSQKKVIHPPIFMDAWEEGMFSFLALCKHLDRSLKNVLKLNVSNAVSEDTLIFLILIIITSRK